MIIMIYMRLSNKNHKSYSNSLLSTGFISSSHLFCLCSASSFTRTSSNYCGLTYFSPTLFLFLMCFTFFLFFSGSSSSYSLYRSYSSSWAISYPSYFFTSQISQTDNECMGLFIQCFLIRLLSVLSYVRTYPSRLDAQRVLLVILRSVIDEATPLYFPMTSQFLRLSISQISPISLAIQQITIY